MSKRDDFSARIKRLLAERVAYRCSNPDCRFTTIGPNEDKSKSTSVGEAAHICAASIGGPRYDEDMTVEARTSYENGVWLCSNCATIVDKNIDKYSIELLKAWKKAAEDLAEAELANSYPLSENNDKLIVQFFIKCFDRPAFNDPIRQEGNMENFQKAVEDTLTALNTGVLFDRNGRIIAESKPKSAISNPVWREKIYVISDLLQAVLREIEVEYKEKRFCQREDGFYFFNCREDEEWFDLTRDKIVGIFSSICHDAGLIGLPSLKRNINRRFFND